MTLRKVPFLDMKSPYQELKAELDTAYQRVMESGWYILGEEVKAFENEFAAYCGARHCLGVGNGLEALHLILRGYGIGEGDEVIVPSNTYIATWLAVSYSGARPVPVEPDPRTYNLDPLRVEAAVTPRTRAILPVHLYGQPADMDSLMEIAARHDLKVIEDAAQAQGARYKGRLAGALGHAAGFSFYPGKNLGAFGEAGAIVTSDPDLKARMMTLRDHGQAKRYYHSMVGWNARMDGIQGAVLSIKLRGLAAANAARRAHAAMYSQLLTGTPGVVLPQTAPGNEHVFHIYAVRVKHRDQVLQLMAQRGVNCAIHYPVPIHLQEAYAFLGLKSGAYPVAERCAGEFLSLPMYPELSETQIQKVANELKSCVAEMRG